VAKPRVTEEDIRLTEALIGQSFARLKTSVAKAPHDLVSPATTTIREHPFATAAAAAGAGMIAFRILNMFMPRVVVKKVPAQHKITVKEGGQSTLTSQVMSIAMPYVMGFVQQELGKMIAGREQHR